MHQHQGRYALDGVAPQQFRCRVAVHLDQPHLGLEFRCCLFEDRRHRLAGTTPGGPEVNEQRDVAVPAMLIEASGIVERRRPPLVKRAMARPALGTITQSLARQAVDGVAMRADDVQRTGHVNSGQAQSCRMTRRGSDRLDLRQLIGPARRSIVVAALTAIIVSARRPCAIDEPLVLATARGPRSRNMIARSEETQMIPIRNAVPSRYPPVITWMLIAANCLVFVFQDSLNPSELVLFVRQFALIPALYSDFLASGETDLAASDFLPFFTMMFLHGGWLHLILNMWTLWLFSPVSIVPALGASGAIAGILGCFMRLFPLARIVVIVPILFIPLFVEVYAFVFIGL